jgi:raffinose/stachyose/melibiose transport system substrate-binding protein
MHYFVKDAAVHTPQELAFWPSIDKFLKSHPNVDLVMDNMVHDSYDTKIKTLAAANQLPDVFLLKGSWIDTWAQAGLITPINWIPDTNKAWKDGFLAGVFDPFMRNGKDIYGIPEQLTITSLVYYNAAIFEKAGIRSFPKTWPEFEKAIQAIKTAGYTPIALGNKDKWVAESCILSTLGDRYTGTDWFFKVRDGKGAKFTDPEFVQALGTFQKLAASGAFNKDFNSIDNNQQEALFFNGSAAMFIEGEWALTGVISSSKPEVLKSVRLAILPSIQGGKGASNAVSGGASWSWGVKANLSDEKKKAVSDLIVALTDRDYQKQVLEAGGFAFASYSPYDKSKLHPLNQQLNTIMASSKLAPIYDILLSAPVVETMNSGLQVLLIGAQKPFDLAKQIQAAAESKD